MDILDEQHDLHLLELRINGDEVSLWVEPGESLMDLLRERLQLLGTKAGCEGGECGACTVLLDGDPVYACLLLAVQAQGCEVTTIEGLCGPDGSIHPIQRAFIKYNAALCGFCSPGMILSSVALLRQNSAPSDEEICFALEGHLCRCGAHNKIVEAIRSAQREGHDHAL